MPTNGGIAKVSYLIDGQERRFCLGLCLGLKKVDTSRVKKLKKVDYKKSTK